MCLWEAVIRTILKGATPEERAKAAEQVCLTIDRSRLTEEGRMAAEEILPILAEDACELVRRALAVTLKSSPTVPRHIALKLARDRRRLPHERPSGGAEAGGTG